ncbi:MAG TPA: aminotransferase class V-fold PLP-dependent enzyme, partial [Bacillota bacterium]|nr:aminotransferase class V-fold PLP-dependent enzyme [Bacillota bacterium]
MGNEQKRVYLDNAATTKVRSEVIDAMMSAFTEDYGNASSIYKEGQTAKKRLEEARESIAKSLGAMPDEIFFTSCGSESDNWAIKGVAKKFQEKKKHIITSVIEHHAILHSCKALEKEGFEITYLPVDEYGLVNPDDLEKAIRNDTALVTIMMANNEIGTIEPIQELCAIAKKHGVLFHTDAVQAVGTIPVNVKELGVDMLSLSGHKINAPKGIGVLYIRKGLTIANLIDGGAQERRRRAGTENLPYIIGLAKALELACEEMDSNIAILSDIRDTLIREVLEKIPHTRLNGHPIKRLPGNANFSFRFIEGE